MPPHSRLPFRAALAAALLAATLAATLAPAVGAQDTSSTRGLQPTPDSQLVAITLKDGSMLIGRVLEVTPTVVRFRSAVGESSIPRDAIVSVRLSAAGAAHGGEYWPEDPSRTRLFFAPTGRMLRQGEGYFSDAYVFFPSFQGGLSNRFTLGAGMSIIPGVGIDEQLYYLTPKVGILSGPRVNVAIGALVAGIGTLSDVGPVGIGYGVATFGGEDASVTTGVGFGFDRSSTSQALLMLGGSTRVSRNIAFVSENYLYTGRDSHVLASGGIRFMGEKLAVDLAGFTTGESEIPIVPYLAFIYRF
jgi:hypothetical protein